MSYCGPSQQSLNMTHMFDFVDYRTCKPPEYTANENTVAWYLLNNKEVSLFAHIVKRSGMMNLFSGSLNNSTLFIPTDSYIKNPKVLNFIKNIDVGDARQIVNASTMNNILNSDIMRSVPNAYYTTRNPHMRAYIFNVSGDTYINDTIKIVQSDICLKNGMIHILDNLIIPSDCHFIN